MTRFLSESLQAPEPYFRLHLRGLEKAHGNPGADIGLTSSITHAVRQKLTELELDAADTTPRELYLALQSRLKADDARLTRRLRTLAATHVSAEADVVAGMAHAMTKLTDTPTCYGLKASSAKRLIKALPPKKAMKALGYRSLDSMLKQEPVAAVLTAAILSETPTWRRTILDKYKKLTPRDFEDRPLSIVQPRGKRWQRLAGDTVAAHRHNLFSFPEVGAIVLLPLPAQAPAGSVTASLALALQAANLIQVSSTFLKLGQVRSDFGSVVKLVATEEPLLSAHLLDRQVSWQLVHRYYAKLRHHFRADLFEPHLTEADMSWRNVEETLAGLEPSFKFWQGNAHLGMLADGRAVSLNLLDAAINACNEVRYELRSSVHYQTALWHELQIKYLQPKVVEATILHELQPKLAFAPALA